MKKNAMPGISRLLPQKKFSKRFWTEVRRHLAGLQVTVFDLETGVLPGYVNGNPFGVPKGKEALCGLTSRVLVAGLMDADLAYEGICVDDEKALLEKTMARLSQVYQSGGLIVGHRILSFDLPYLLDRLIAHEMTVPAWLRDVLRPKNKYRTRKLRVIDTSVLCNARTTISRESTSISNVLPVFWGREGDSFGARFGELWGGGDPVIREQLLAYNRWNLLDSILLALHSGAIDEHRVSEVPPCPVGALPKGQAWNGSDYDPDSPPVVVGNPPQGGSDIVLVGWITAPLAGLKANGPVGKGWGRLRPETIAQRPFTAAGRQDPFVMQVVGFVCVGPSVCSVVFEPADELAVLVKALALLHSAKASGNRVFTGDAAKFRSMLLFRGSLYGLVFQPWVMGFSGREWISEMEDVLPVYSSENGTGPLAAPVCAQAVRDGALQGFAEVEQLPTYCGQAPDQFLARVRWCALAARRLVEASPLLQELGASPFHLLESTGVAA